MGTAPETAHEGSSGIGGIGGSSGSDQKIIIVGAGAAGVGAALGLIDDWTDSIATSPETVSAFVGRIKLFERRATPGGLWNYTSEDHAHPIPSTDPNQSATRPLRSAAPNGSTTYTWPSAVYDELDTNVPHEFMTYHKRPWPRDSPVFPQRDQVRQYLSSVAETIAPLISYETAVLAVEPAEHGGWRVTTQHVSGDAGSTRVHFADAVIVANGHYDVPRIPSIAGLAEWASKYPGTIIHSKQYKSPRAYEHLQRVVVVGNSASAVDCANQLADRTGVEVLQSIRSAESEAAEAAEAAAAAGPGTISGANSGAGANANKGVLYRSPRITAVGEIAVFDVATRSIRLVDGSTQKNVDLVIFATGFMKSMPFLKDLSPPLVTDGARLHHLWRHIVAFKHKNLFVAGAPKYGGPMILAQLQGAWISRVLRSEIRLPSEAAMQEWESKRLTQFRGREHAFHNLGFPDDVDYYNSLVDDIESSSRPTGTYPPRLSEKQAQTRSEFRYIKSMYQFHTHTSGDLATGSWESMVQRANRLLQGETQRQQSQRTT